jgi:hypothetical protein
MSRARIHQYVPIFYLKGWRSARDSKLARYSRIRGEIRVDRCSARATGFEPDLYQLTHVAEGERDAIERWLAQEVDTPASEALRVQLRGGQLMPDQHVAWVRFVMSMRARSPDAITMIRQTGDRNVREAQLRASLRNMSGCELLMLRRPVGMGGAARSRSRCKFRNWRSASIDRERADRRGSEERTLGAPPQAPLDTPASCFLALCLPGDHGEGQDTTDIRAETDEPIATA